MKAEQAVPYVYSDMIASAYKTSLFRALWELLFQQVVQLNDNTSLEKLYKHTILSHHPENAI